MTWFNQNMTPEEAKQVYRDLAKKYHPDVSTEPDAEETFKQIADEYTAFTKGVFSTGMGFDSEVVINDTYSKFITICKLVGELYPRVNVNFMASDWLPIITFFDDNVPMWKSMHIVDITDKFLDSSKSFYVHFNRTCRKKKFEALWVPVKRYFLIDCKETDVPNDLQLAPGGRRYLYSSSKTWEQVHDMKTDVIYEKKKVARIDLRKDILGL